MTRMIKAGRHLRGILVLAVCAWMLAGTAQAVETVTYYHTDALGTPVMESNAGGAITYAREHRPYGEQVLPVSAPKDGPGFTGHVGDADTGLTYMEQRYYDPGTGRFLSVDPVTADNNAGGNFNRYWYANNNPYTYYDPDGRQPCSDACMRLRASSDGMAGGGINNSGIGGVGVSPATETYRGSIPAAPTSPFSQPTEPNAHFDWCAEREWCNSRNWFTGAGSLTDFDAIVHDLAPALYLIPGEGQGLALSRPVGGFMNFAAEGMLASKILGPSGRIFGRQWAGGRSMLGINSNSVLRVGWGWVGSAKNGTNVFRISGNWIKALGVKSGHIDLWTQTRAIP